MKKLNFKKVKTTGLDGEEINFDLSKELPQMIYYGSPDLSLLSVALDIYKTGDVDDTPENRKAILNYFKSDKCPFIIAAKKAVIDMLESN